jgi:hypothetical protein
MSVCPKGVSYRSTPPQFSEGQHEPIITQELWDPSQAVRASRRVVAKTDQKAPVSTCCRAWPFARTAAWKGKCSHSSTWHPRPCRRRPAPTGEPSHDRVCASPDPGGGLKVLNFALISSKRLNSPLVFSILVRMSASALNPHYPPPADRDAPISPRLRPHANPAGLKCLRLRSLYINN